MKISKVPMALKEGEAPWYHKICLEDGKWVERWVQYEEGDPPEEDEPNIIFKSNCPSLIPPWYYCKTCNYRLSLDFVYCPKCGTALDWEHVEEEGDGHNVGRCD